MARYTVEASSADGRSKEKLSVEAISNTDAARLVLSQGRFPVSVRRARTGWMSKLDVELWGGSRLVLSDLAMFAEQLASLIQAGVAVEQALELLSRPAGAGAARADKRRFGGPDKALASLCQRLLKQVREGSPLSAALKAEPRVSPAFAGVVQGAESAGALGAGLASLAVSVQRQHETRQRVRAALAYPGLVLVVAMSALLFILTAVIPEFAPLFTGEEHRLPPVTRAVLWLSDLFTGRLLLISVMLAVLVAAARWVWMGSVVVRTKVWLAAKHLAPVRHAVQLDLAQATQVMGTLLESGIEASRAMQLAAQSAAFAVNRDALAEGTRLLREGGALSVVYAAMPGVPDAAATLMAVGERAGHAGAAALRAAQHMEAESNRRIGRLLAVLNPVAVLSMGALVALFIAAVMLGILSINQLALR